MSPSALLLHPDDDVLLALRPLAAGEEGSSEAIRAGHKFARHALAGGSAVRKFGQIIGRTTGAVAAGAWLHDHNLVLGSDARDHAIGAAIPPDPPPLHGRTFRGYRRPDGRAGTRNYLAVIASVNCSASVARFIARRFSPEWLADVPGVDGIVALAHKGGCAIQVDGEEHRNLSRTLAGFATHPNIGGVLLVGLGCETASIAHLKASTGLAAELPVLLIQDSGGTVATVEAGVRELGRLLPAVAAQRRVEIPAAELVVGLECGGSDGFSGISANPVIGACVDRLVAAGGTAILAETPEIYGAEHLLTRRARSPQVAERLLERIAWWERYAAFFGASIDNNPTAGNKAGGLTTIAEKSMGAVAKAGSTALEAVYHYAERIERRGLVFMDSPGFDPVSITGMVAGGANLVLFSTGRGSCYGCKPAPSLKICSNTQTFERLRDDMDFDAGRVMLGADIQQLGAELFDLVLRIASGEPSRSEVHGLGDEEFAPWSIGPIL